MKKLNIAMFSDSFYPIWGGRENVIHNLMSNLNEKTNCFLLTTKFPGHKTFINDSDLPYDIFRCKSIRITKNEYLSIIDRKTKKIIETKIKNGEIDIIHTQTKYALTKYALKLKKKYGIPVVTSAHTNYICQYKNQLKCPLLYKPFLHHVKRIINKTDGVFTVSNYMKNMLLQMGVTVPICIIPNGNDLVDYKDSSCNLSALKKEFKIQDNNLIFMYSGRIVETKNLTFLLDSLNLLKQSMQNFKILFVGDGNIDKYKSYAKKINLSDNCIFTGAITDRKKLAMLYKLSDLYLYPSTGESFGLTIREAGIMGTPSVTIENCATSEDILHNENGFISKNSIEDFSQTILNAIHNPQLPQIGINASKAFNQSWEDITTIHINKYEEFINKK